MKTSWVLTDDERFRRFRKHREKITAKRRFSDEQIHPALAYGAEQGPESPRLHIAEELEGDEEETAEATVSRRGVDDDTWGQLVNMGKLSTNTSNQFSDTQKGKF